LESWFGEIVGQLVVIDINPWRVILEIDVNPEKYTISKDVDEIVG
jgi:hypothetical protein